MTIYLHLRCRKYEIICMSSARAVMCRLQRKGMELDMARKNRISLPDAVYHVTARIAHRAMLFAADGVKDRIMQIIYGTAFFSGVEVYACCVMDNHLHILVHVPTVPERLWTEAGREPDSYAFGMRPPECRRPMWPRPQKVTAPVWGGDCPRGVGTVPVYTRFRRQCSEGVACRAFRR